MARVGVEYFPLGLLGVALAVHLRIPGMALWFLALAAAAVFLVLFRRRCFGMCTRVILALALAAGLAAVFVTAQGNYLQTRALPLPRHDYIEFTGRLCAFPRIGPRDSILLLDVSRVVFRHRQLRVDLRLRLRVPEDMRHLARGDRVRVAARIRPAEPFFMARGIHFTGHCKSALQVRLEGHGSPVWSFLGNWRCALRRGLEKHFADGNGGVSDRGALLEALLLGDRGRVSAALRESMLDAGVFHLMAISGAHVGILALIVVGGLGTLRVQGALKFMVAAAALLVYLALADFPVSAVRAGVMAGILFLGKALDHPANGLRSLSLAGFFFMAAAPLTCLGPGFILTFSLAAAIIVGRGMADRLAIYLPRAVSETISAGLNASCFSLPLTLVFFQRFSLVGPLAGMVLLPLCGPVMALGLPLLGCCLFSPLLSAWLLKGLDLLLGLFLAGIKCAAALDSTVFRPSPGLQVVGLTALLFLAAHGAPKSRQRRGAAALLLVVMAAQVWPYPPRRPARLEVFYLDVGQGDCACVVFPGGDGLLIDGGGSRNPDFAVGRRAVLPFLLRNRIRIRWMAISHFHPDHAAGLLEILPVLRPEEVWISAAPRGNFLYEKLIVDCPATTRLRRVTAGSVLETSGCRVVCLHPRVFNSSPGVCNDDSQVLLVEDDRHAFLFTGDAGIAVEDRLRLSFSAGTASRVLKTGHHGSATSTSPGFLARVSPSLAVVSCAAGNPFGFPHATVLKHLRKCGVPWLCTAWSGHVRVCPVRQGIRVFQGPGEWREALIFRRISHSIQ